MARTLTVRDLRLHWPDAERRLRREGELVVTRDGQPVAKLSPYHGEEPARARWSAAGHRKWLNRIWKGRRRGLSTDELLARDRAE